MNARRISMIISLLVVVTNSVSACSPAAPAPTQAPAMAEAKQSAASGAPAAAPAAQPTMAPAPTAAPAAAGQLPSTGVNASPQRATRLIIKNGEMALLVTDTDRALDQVTGVAVDSGGYIVSSKTWLQDGFKYAMVTMGVPVDQFEVAQRRLRALAVQVLSDTASGQDVSDEYVDLQSRLTNQEATAARIRDFLKDAKTVEEALKVNSQLSEVEAEIEQIKGRMQYLTDRSAYSTIVVNLEQQRPTPTPTATPTPTPTPTPVYWMPEKTVGAAADTLGGLLRALGDFLIWVVIVILPLAIPVLAVIALIVYFRRRTKKPAVRSNGGEKPGI